jgi:choline dehydrogenase-like flavoprotein
MFQAMRIMAEVFLTSGAKQVHLPLFGSTPVRNPDDLKFLTEPGVPARMVECITFHPLGSARMGVDAQRGVVSPTGESFELPGLYVSDGSLFPTSIGVNSQLPIMTMATRIARGLREKLTSHRIRPNVGVVAAESVAQVAAQ